jgi:hypothetical protein
MDGVAAGAGITAGVVGAQVGVDPIAGAIIGDICAAITEGVITAEFVGRSCRSK